MSEELMLMGSLDQPTKVDTSSIFQQIDEKIQESVNKRSSIIALNVCRELVGIGQVTGLALAKALYLVWQNWSDYDDVEGDFEEAIIEYVGLHKSTIHRYIKVWRMFDQKQVPDNVREGLQQRNIKDLIPIANIVSEGYEICDEDWDDLINASNFQEVSVKTRDIQGKPPRKQALQIMMDKEGTLRAIKDNKFGHVGFLAVDEDNEVSQQAIERIKKSSGIMET